jgi:hypothetical protein
MIFAYRFPHALLALGLGASLALAACGGTTDPTPTTATYADVQKSLVALSCSAASCHDSKHVGFSIDTTMTAAINCANVTKYVVANSPATSQLITVPKTGMLVAGGTHTGAKVTSFADGTTTRTSIDGWINAGASCQ